jgi:penicillin-binding protein 2
MAVQGMPEFHIEKAIEPGLQSDTSNWSAVHTAMRRVVDAGTATAARIPGFGVGGKTGTAQNPHGKDHALFVCYAPTDVPRIAIAIVAENSGHGGSVCAPIAARVLRRVLLGDSLATAPKVAAKRDSTVRKAATDTTETLGD